MTSLLQVRRPGAASLLSPGRDLLAAAVQDALQDLALETRIGLGHLRSVAAGALPWFVRGLVAVAVVAFAGLALGPHVLGYRTLTMLTGSMSPEIDPGDIAVVTPLAVSEVAAGMVITYHIPVEDHRVVTHRVVSVERAADGRVTVQTKGDANDHLDPWKATLQGDTAYQVRAVIPGVGTAIQALRTPVVSQLLTYGATSLLAAWALLAIWRPTETTDETDRTDETDLEGGDHA